MATSGLIETGLNGRVVQTGVAWTIGAALLSTFYISHFDRLPTGRAKGW
jgi:hypothetical protein